MPPASADSKPMYAKDEKALCFHGELLYEAKVLEVKKIDPKDKTSPYEYRVHYKGWKNTWDDWVTQDRLRKLTDDNKELAANLRREVQQQQQQTKSRPTATSKSRKQGSELGSGRGSEERHSSVPAGGRGTKRGRDNDIEKGARTCAGSVLAMPPKKKTAGKKKSKKNAREATELPAAPLPESGSEIEVMPKKSSARTVSEGSGTIQVTEEPAAGTSTVTGGRAVTSAKATASSTIVLRFPQQVVRRARAAPDNKVMARKRNARKPGAHAVKPSPPRAHTEAVAPRRKPAMIITPEEVAEEEENVMDILSRSPPDDEEEFFSKATQKARKADASVHPWFRPLLSGSSAAEKQQIRRELIADGANLLSKQEWLQILRENGINIEHDWDIKLNLYIKKCVPERLRHPNKDQWRHMAWLMDAPVEANHHTKYVEARHEGDHAKMLYYQDAKPRQKLPIAGVPKDPQVIDAPGSGGPFDALRHRDRLIDFLNTRDFWNEPTWTAEALAKIPASIMADVSSRALAMFPHSVLNSQPQHIIDRIPEDAPYFHGLDGTAALEKKTKMPLATKDTEAFAEAASARERSHRTDHTFDPPRQSKGKQPIYESAASDPAAHQTWLPSIASMDGASYDSNETPSVPNSDSLMNIPSLKAATTRLHLNHGLTLPKKPVSQVLEQKLESSPDKTFLGRSYHCSDVPSPPDWQPMTTINPNTHELIVVDAMDPAFWNSCFHRIPVPANIYEVLKTREPIADMFIQEEHFANRPSIRLPIPDQLKSLLVDDWENVTKSLLLVPLPSQAPCNYIIDTYYNEQKHNRRPGSADADLLLELCCGLKLYFEKAVGKILLYRFERLQLADVRKLWESGRYPEWEGRGPGDCYGAEHLTRMIVNMPEIIAQTNMDQQSITRLKEELTKFCTWLSRNSAKFFCAKYEKPSAEYIESAR